MRRRIRGAIVLHDIGSIGRDRLSAAVRVVIVTDEHPFIVGRVAAGAVLVDQLELLSDRVGFACPIGNIFTVERC